MPEMFSEGYVESTLRWHLYRRWRRRQDPHRVGERMFYDVALRAPKGSIFLDLGANVGLVTGAALSLGLKVVAFEPDPHALATLTRRFGRHPDVEIIPKAIGAGARTATFYRNRHADEGQTAASSMIESAYHDDRGDAARRCRHTRRGNRLAMLAAGLADEDAAIDQTWNDGLSRAVDDRGAFRHTLVQRRLAGGQDLPALDDDRADLVDPARGIDDMRRAEDRCRHGERRRAQFAAVTHFRPAGSEFEGWPLMRTLFALWAAPLLLFWGWFFLSLNDMAGLPGISVPAGLDAKGLPLGLQLIGRPFDEETLFQTAHVIEQAAGTFQPEKWW